MHKETEESKNYQISDYNYITSALGNGYFSGLSMTELWDCIYMSTNREELDAAITATISLKELTKKEN